MGIFKNGTMIAGIPSTDNATITYNSNNALQSSGLINKNSAPAADLVKYDWVGTTAEYIAQDIEHTHPEYTCYITDDQGGIGLIYNAAQSDLRYFKKDNEDKTIISGLGYPDVTRAESLTPLASGAEYTATANGWFFASSVSTSNNAHTYIRYMANTTDIFRFLDWKPSSGGPINVWCPVKSGETVAITYSSATLSRVYFVPAYGQLSNS